LRIATWDNNKPINKHHFFPQTTTMMNSVFSALVVLALVAGPTLAAECVAEPAGAPFKATSGPTSDPTSCSWYESDSCCEAGFDSAPFLAAFEEASDTCSDYIGLVYCGACSPLSSDFMSSNNDGDLSLKLCKDWCSEIWTACQDSKDKDGVAYSEIYSSSDDFCAGAFSNYAGDISVTTANGGCFNAATVLSPSSVAATIAVIAVAAVSAVLA